MGSHVSNFSISAVLISFSITATQQAQADTDFSFQPRAWYVIQSNSTPAVEYFPGAGAYTQTQTPFVYPFVGGTLGISGSWLGNASIAITVLNGKGKSNFTENFNDLIDPTQNFIAKGFSQVDRTDAEALVVLPIKQSPSGGTSVFIGVRSISFFGTQTSTEYATLTSDYTVPTEFAKQVDRSYFLETGFGLNSSVTDDNKHQLFANVVGLLGRTYDRVNNFGSSSPGITSVDQWTGGIDANVGYSYKFNDNMTLLTRYRVFLTAPLENWSGGNNLIHGPEVGLRYEFK